MTERPGLSYRDAGVDLDAAESTKERLKALVAATRDENTLSELGQFGGLYAVPAGMNAPVLVSSADGVGTKLKVAFRTGRHDTVGEDLVNHCVNDILVQGARPLFFLDYVASGRMDPQVVPSVVLGIARGCRENGCALLGGETAQMPDFYSDGEYDLAGFIVGIVEREKLLDGSRIRPGDTLVALPSSGLHTNGYTLARKIVFDVMGLRPDDALGDLGESAGPALLRVHRSYLKELTPALDDDLLGGMAHITGGGIPGNLPRVLPEGCGARIDRTSWEAPRLFRILQEAGGVEEEEMFRVFNMGVGMLCAVHPSRVEAFLASLGPARSEAWIAGEVIEGQGVEWA